MPINKMNKINLNEIPKEILDEIFESMAFDEHLARQLDIIDNHPKLTEEQKLEYHNKRVGIAFYQEARKRLGKNLPLLKEVG